MKKKKLLACVTGLTLLTIGNPITGNITVEANTPQVIQVQTKQNHSYINFKTSVSLEEIVKKEPGIEPHASIIQNSIDKYKGIYDVSPSIIVALLKFETVNFNQYAISPAGAAGIAQFIPETAIKKFGLKAHFPKYLTDARNYRREARKEEAEAKRYLRKLWPNTAIKHMKKSQQHNKEANKLFKKYKAELTKMIKNDDGSYKTEAELKKFDERLILATAIDSCVKYIAELLKERKGDIRESVSAYNAGLHAVERYGGIPPYDETVKYQNKIINKIKYYENIP